MPRCHEPQNRAMLTRGIGLDWEGRRHWPGDWLRSSFRVRGRRSASGTPGRSCFSTGAFNYNDQSEFNVCTNDGCTSDSDCLNDAIRVPKGTLGRPIAFCISAVCHSDADCTEYGVGRCTPMIDECSGGYWTFACAYALPGSCKTNADCSRDAPPFGPGERYCHLGACSEVFSGTVCN